jgi:pimeloyl-ACP methyl ester carboxylesterase
MNGPLRRVDPIARALGRLARTPGGSAALRATLFQPTVWQAWLRSSVGLRRAVVNPYVMDRDTVALLCGRLVESDEGRRAVAAWLRGLRDLPEPRAFAAPLLLLWGDADPLFGSAEAAFFEALVPGARHVSVPGGQHAHPEERPWEVADRLSAWLSEQGFAGSP